MYEQAANRTYDPYQHSASEASATDRRSEVQTALEALAKSLEEAHELQGQLCQRLQPVIAQRPTEAGADKNTPAPVRVALAETIYKAVHRVHLLTQVQRDLLGSIEL